MDITAPANDRATAVDSPWGVPWPSDGDLLADADSAWAIERGFVDHDPFGGPLPSADADHDGVSTLGSEPDSSSPGLSPTQLLDELARRVRDRHRATAAEYRLIGQLLHGAAADPVPWVGPDPTLDVEWNDSRRRTVAAVRRDRRDMAERAAVAEIATRLRLSEQTVRTRAAHAEMLQTRCPEVWNAFADGLLSERHAVESARLATSLPDDDSGDAPTQSDEPVPDAGRPDAPADGPPAVPAEGALDVPAEGSLDAIMPAVDPSSTPSGEAPSASGPPASWRAFDEGARDRALRLPPARFTVAARALRERVHSESIEARHRRAARDRGVWLTPELDGMATLTALLPADRAQAALSRVDRIARHLRGTPGEERTLAQLRADAAADLLTADVAPPVDVVSAADVPSPVDIVSVADLAVPGSVPVPEDAPRAPRDERPIARVPRPDRRSTIVVTVPALTLLGAGAGAGAGAGVGAGAGAEPATLDGYGPIDLDTARRLAGEATSWVRVLTHPLTGAPLALDRSTYRVPTALRRWLGVTSPTCVFPGCGRPARDCDIDHLTAWVDGGATDDDNLAPECRHHHRLRHESRWEPSRDPATGEMRWTSPLGAEIAEDPPPF